MNHILNRYGNSALLLALVLTLAVGSANGQRKIGGSATDGATTGGYTNLRGLHSISGTVTWKNGSLVRSRIRVKLSSFQGVDFTTTTDDEGKFSFSQVINGTYTVSVDDDRDHGPASATVDIALPARSPPQNFPVTLAIEPKNDTAAKPGIVSAEDAGVPRTAVALYEKAVALSKYGNHAGAIALLEKAVAEYHDFLAAQNELGVQYLTTGDLNKADAALTEALKIKPDSFQALMNRGVVLLRLDRVTEAEPLLEQAAAANPTSATALLYLGRLRYALKKYDSAETSLKAALGLGGKDVNEAHRTLAKLYVDKQEFAKAADELQIYIKVNPGAHDADQLRKMVGQLRSAAQEPQPTPKP
jgi:uncharacterized protein HemY